jgi:DnaK suppressor protein
VSKPPAKTAKAPIKPAAKPAAKNTLAKPAAKTAAKAAPKVAAKPAAKPTAKAPPKPAPKPASPPVSKAPAPAPAKAPIAKAPVAPVKASSKTPPPAAVPKAAAAGKSAPAAPPPQPAPAPLTNRFTDRFAPAAKPAARPMTETAELPKPVQKIDPKLANAWKSKPGRELTEPELLAMPESEYMNDKQLDFFRARLQQQKDDLLSSAGETTEHLREDTSIVPDPVDRATIEEEHALELRTRDRERKLLKKIAQSLARLDTGEYGYCDETGEPIGLQRLMARPTASLSLEAQQRRELKQKMFGD